MHRYSMFAIACGLLASGSVAQAAIETWVSGNGTDAGNCPITAPCRTFAFAHTQTSNNGAINVLSSGNFGPLTITKPISIVAEGVEAVINTGAGGAAIIVNAGAAAVVSLRGLTIDLRGTDNLGIRFTGGAALHVHRCVIRKASDGIRFMPASGTSELYMSDTVVSEASGNANIFIAPEGSASVNVVLDRVRAENATLGMAFYGGFTTGSVTGIVRDSVVAGNTSSGINVFEDGVGLQLMIDRTAVVNNNTGISDGSGPGGHSTIRIGNSTVTGNTGVAFNSSDPIFSYENNKTDGNGGISAPLSIIPLK